jgi:hypothetical protein
MRRWAGVVLYHRRNCGMAMAMYTRPLTGSFIVTLLGCRRDPRRINDCAASIIGYLSPARFDLSTLPEAIFRMPWCVAEDLRACFDCVTAEWDELGCSRRF